MLSRRTLLLSAVASSAATTFAGLQTVRRALAETNSAPQTVLRLERRGIDVNGKAASVYRISQPDGSWGLTTQKGAVFRVRVENRISEPSLIHWHGLTPPWQQDGVPAFPDRRSRPAEPPITTFHCASAARSGCTRIRDCRSSF